MNEFLSAESLDLLTRNLSLSVFDPRWWLGDNFPTLAKYWPRNHVHFENRLFPCVGATITIKLPPSYRAASR
jgi:hypothetical protein